MSEALYVEYTNTQPGDAEEFLRELHYQLVRDLKDYEIQTPVYISPVISENDSSCPFFVIIGDDYTIQTSIQYIENQIHTSGLPLTTFSLLRKNDSERIKELLENPSMDFQLI